MRGPGTNPLRSAQKRIAVTTNTVPLDRCLFLGTACFTDDGPRTPTLQVIAHQIDKNVSGSWIHDVHIDYSRGRYTWSNPAVLVEESSLWCFALEPIEGDDVDQAPAPSATDENVEVSSTSGSEKKTTPPWQRYKIQWLSVTPVFEFLPLLSSAPIIQKKGRPLPFHSQNADSWIDNDLFMFLQEIRRIYFEKGIRTPPSSKTIFVSADYRYYAGPVKWKRRDDNNDALYIADADDRQQVCASPAFRKDQTQVLNKDIAGRSLRLLLLDSLSEPYDSFDLRPDSQLLQEQLAAWQAKATSEHSWPEIDADLSRSPLSKSFSEFRLKEILAAWDVKQEQSNALESFLLKTDTAKELLQHAVDKAVAEQRAVLEASLADLEERHSLALRQVEDAEQRAEALAADSAKRRSAEDEAFTQAHSRLTETKSLVAAAQLELRALQRLTRDARLVAGEKAKEIEAHVLDRIGHLKSHAAEELAALLPIRHALGLDQIVVQVNLPPVVETVKPTLEQPLPTGLPTPSKRQLALKPPFDAKSQGTYRSFDDLADVRTRLKRGLRDSGGVHWESLCVPVLAAMMAGLVPVVAVEESRTFWGAVAESVAGGRRLSIYSVPGSREPLDLFGRLEGDIFFPHAHRLADLMLSSCSSDSLSLVTLENVDALDWNAVLLPMLSARAEERPLALIHPHVAEASGSYAGLTSVLWSPSLLLTGSWSSNSFPPPSTFFRQAILLLPEGLSEEINVGNGNPVSWTGTEWKNALATTRIVETADLEGARIEINGHPTIPSSAVGRFFRALRVLVTNEEARRLMRQHAILPPLVAQGNSIEGAKRETVSALQRLFFGHGAL